jgi:hypothetical protein
MRKPKNKSNKKAVAYEVVQVDNNKLKLIEGRYALSKEEQDKLDNMIITVGGTYKIEKDPKTGRISRIEDGRTLSEISKAKYDRLLENYEKEER